VTKAAITESILRWALDRSGKTPEHLQRKFPRIRQWLTGERQPTLRQLEIFAKATQTPLGFFFLKKPPEERIPIPYFRTIGDEKTAKPSPNLLETIYTMQRRQEWMRDYLIEKGNETLSFVNTAKTEEEPEIIAERVRGTLGLTEGWAAQQRTWTEALSALREALERIGILVVTNSVVQNNTHRKLNPTEFRGFVLVDEYAPLVFVNGADAKAAQMFTVAHELAHIFFGSSAAFDLREMQPAQDATEQASNKVAAELLVPASEIKAFWNSTRNRKGRFDIIARRFKVSPIVAARRALDLNLVNKEAFLEFYRNYEKEERIRAKKQSEGGDFYLTQNLRVGRRFAATVFLAAREGSLLYTDAYRLTGLYGKTFNRYAAALGIEQS
jgi:Zn-dependent peptidase ImmA (M78 family)